MGLVRKSYIRKGFIIYEEMRKYLTIYEEAVIDINAFATDPYCISYEKNCNYFFISVPIRIQDGFYWVCGSGWRNDKNDP
jgi:hypothetical protein